MTGLDKDEIHTEAAFLKTKKVLIVFPTEMKNLGYEKILTVNKTHYDTLLSHFLFLFTKLSLDNLS